MIKFKPGDLVLNLTDVGWMPKNQYGTTLLMVLEPPKLDADMSTYRVQGILNKSHPDAVGKVSGCAKHALEESYHKVGRDTVTKLSRLLYDY